MRKQGISRIPNKAKAGFELRLLHPSVYLSAYVCVTGKNSEGSSSFGYT